MPHKYLLIMSLKEFFFLWPFVFFHMLQNMISQSIAQRNVWDVQSLPNTLLLCDLVFLAKPDNSYLLFLPNISSPLPPALKYKKDAYLFIYFKTLY